MLDTPIKNNKNGFTLIEVLVSVAIFVMVAVAIYTGFLTILKAMAVVRVNSIMTTLANEKFEIVRNLQYKDIGTVSGIPSGVLSQSQVTPRDGKNFLIKTVVRNFDDPFDGTFDGKPKDTSPADMKMVELTISCQSCKNTSSISFTTKVAPKNLETASTNGALVVKVFDASGVPVPQADVNIINNSIVPNINLNDKTDDNGLLTIVDAPPSNGSYQITVSKSGYSTERTYPSGIAPNLNPVKPNITVLVQQITQVSFTIDKVSSLNISSINNMCAVTSNFNFSINGNKLIGKNPVIYKYSQSLATNSLGVMSLSNVEWDTYMVNGTDSLNDIIGTNPLLSLGINPETSLNMQIITAPKNGRRLLVVVRDQSTGLSISDATVTLTGPSSYNKTFVTNEGFMIQTDWSLGGGQSTFTDPNKYLSSDGNIDSTTLVGNIKLKNVLGSYASSGVLTSSTFDTGSISNFKQIIWNPISQSAQTGVGSVKLQIATNNDNLTWNYVGPDGTSNTYYTSSNQNIDSSHNGHQYLRYRISLSTVNTSFSPMVSDISVTFASSCIPPGQVSFSALQTGTYNVLVSKTGYQSTSKKVTIDSNWRKEEITISQ